MAAGTVAGAAGLAAADAVARARQRPNEIPALWSRILASGAVAAPLGWTADRLARGIRSRGLRSRGGDARREGIGPVPVATAAGAAAGALGLRPQKVALGPVAGAAIGFGLRQLGASPAAAGVRRGGRGGGGRRLPDGGGACCSATRR